MNMLKKAFQGFDPNNLDLNTAGSWPIGVKIIAFVIVFAGIIAAGIHFHLTDQHKQLDNEIRKEATLKTQFERKAFQVANLDALRQQMTDVEERFAELLRQLPSDKEVPGLIEDISDIGKAAGLTINNIALQPERKTQFYIELPISIQVSGTYHEMGQFVSGVAAIKRIVTLHNYSLRPAGENAMTMSIEAKTYRYDDED